jgi:hypothetical protein
MATIEVRNITSTSAEVHVLGVTVGDGIAFVYRQSGSSTLICYPTTYVPGAGGNHDSISATGTNVSHKFTGLTPNTTYIFNAYVNNNSQKSVTATTLSDDSGGSGDDSYSFEWSDSFYYDGISDNSDNYKLTLSGTNLSAAGGFILKIEDIVTLDYTLYSIKKGTNSFFITPGHGYELTFYTMDGENEGVWRIFINFSWYVSNGDASDSQTYQANKALSNKLATTNFNYLVWNDLVNTVESFRKFCSYNSWNEKYAPYSETICTKLASNKKITAWRFNSVRENIGSIYSTGAPVVSQGDTIKGSYFFALTNAIGNYLTNVRNRIEVSGNW